jgi:hypothetical protein
MTMDEKGLVEDIRFTLKQFDRAMQKYEELRIPRTRAILGASHSLGAMQQNRADSWLYNIAKEWTIWFQVRTHRVIHDIK